MKKILLASATAFVMFGACDTLNQVAQDVNTSVNTAGTQPLSSSDIISGLKDALTQGTNKSAQSASQVNGFLNNSLIRIPFPPEAEKVKNFALKIGLTSQVSKFEETLNHAAETAAKSAAPIFVNAIKSMSIADGLNILRGVDTAATHYLRTACTSQLCTTFKPTVHNATQQVGLTKYWQPLADAYNKIPTNQKVNPDLDQYVTNRAVDGLFKLIGNEETQIRTNPADRATDILKKVFGSKDNPHNH